MEKDLVHGSLGDKAKYDVAFKEGKLVAELDADFGVLTGGLVVKISAEQVLDALAKAIPGTLDDQLLGLLKTALKS